MKRPAVILSVNSGSSSFKAALYRLASSADVEARLVARVAATPFGNRFRLRVSDASGAELYDERVEATKQSDVLSRFLIVIRELGLPEADAIGHRVVHGGPELSAPALVTPELLDRLRALTRLAPLHLPEAIDLIEAALRASPDVSHVACFDTAFHRRMPELFQRLPLPRRLWSEGVRRYGFHGLSYESVIRSLGEAAAGRVVIAHLGNGASLAAVRDGEPLDTTMGMTPAGGLVMGTRSGDLDPGVLVYLMRYRGLGPEEIDRLVNQESGLLGVSEATSDMQELLELCGVNSGAKQAVNLFCLSVRKHIGALAASLGGMDQLVFTAAIGENSPTIRAAICNGLEHLGVEIDGDKNSRGEGLISRAGAGCQVRVVPTNEELMIARHTYDLISERR